MTAIHLATRLDLSGPERFIVLREILPHQARDPQALESFLAEAKIASRFDHPNLVTVQEIGKSKGAVFTVIEYLAGEGLGFLLGKVAEIVAGMPAALAAGIAAQAADGLAYAHAMPDTAGLVHGNINLRNIVVLIDGRVKLINFDIGTLASQPHPSRLSCYMSPEQCMGQPVGPATDIFSAGVVLWEMLAGRHLFKRESDLDTRRAVMNCEVPALGDYRRDVDPELETLVNRCLQKDPGARFENAGALAAGLRGWMQIQGVETGIEQIRKLVANVLADRIRLKKNMLEQIEASAEAPVDPQILLPSTSCDLPDKQPIEPDSPAAAAPETSEKVEPITLRQIDRPPALTERQDPAATSSPAPEPEPEFSQKEAELTPPPFEPFLKFSRSYLHLFMKYRPFIIGGAAVLLLIILIAAFSGGNKSGHEADESGKAASALVTGKPIVKPISEEEAQAELAKLAKPKKTAMSILSIKTDPKGCTVMVDKVELNGKTPLRNVMLPSGMEHQVTARCKGYQDESRHVTPRAGESLEIEFYPSNSPAGD